MKGTWKYFIFNTGDTRRGWYIIKFDPQVQAIVLDGQKYKSTKHMIQKQKNM